MGIFCDAAAGLEAQVALQCAPLLAGLKPSNLLIIPKNDKEELRHVLAGTGLSCYHLSEQGDKVILLLYRANELIKYLQEQEVQELFDKLGYAKEALNGTRRNTGNPYNMERGLGQLLLTIAKKYESHQRLGTEFPHELGLVLGYPAVDVYGFMINAGKCCLYSGYWKVYGNLSETLKLFWKFGLAKEIALRLVSLGHSMADIINHAQMRQIQSLNYAPLQIAG